MVRYLQENRQSVSLMRRDSHRTARRQTEKDGRKSRRAEDGPFKHAIMGSSSSANRTDFHAQSETDRKRCISQFGLISERKIPSRTFGMQHPTCRSSAKFITSYRTKEQGVDQSVVRLF
jgi:hypothetical protein